MVSQITYTRIVESYSPYRILIEKIQNHPGQAVVRPEAVRQQQLLQILEARQCKVRGHHGLHALLPGYADTDVGHLNHGHIVGTVADGQRAEVQFLLDDLDQIGLLEGR